MKLKQLIGIAIVRTIGNLSFIRQIEWLGIMSHLKKGRNERILDIACGIGELSLRTARHNYEVYGIDIEMNLVKKASRIIKRRGIFFMAANAEYLPLENDSFDTVVCSSALEHFYNDTEALKEMNRVLKRSGSVIITVDSLSYPVNDRFKQWHKKQFHVVQYYDAKTLENKLQECGFKLVSSKYIFNSPLTSYFYRLFALTFGKTYRSLFICFIGNIIIPLLLISDKLSGRSNCGYTLLVKGEKL